MRAKTSIKVIVGSCVLVALVFAGRWVIHQRSIAAWNSCIGCLKQIDGAKEQWALEYEKSRGAVVAWDDIFGPNRYIKDKPVCPSGGIYTIGKIGEDPHCSFPGPGHSLEEL